MSLISGEHLDPKNLPFDKRKARLLADFGYAADGLRDLLEGRIYAAGDYRVEELLGPIVDANNWVEEKAVDIGDLREAEDFLSAWGAAVSALDSLTECARMRAIEKSRQTGADIGPLGITSPWGDFTDPDWAAEAGSKTQE